MSEKNKAPSVIIDPTVLGDRLPRDRDSIAKTIEDTRNFREKNHTGTDQAFLTNKDAAAVNYLDPWDFIRRLKKLNDGLLFGHGSPGCVSLWVLALDDIPESKTYQRLIPTAIACGFRIDRPLPEFSWLETDDWNVATKEGERGWRTVLIRLIKGGFLKYHTVKAEFGEPLGQRGRLWHQQLQAYKI